MSDATTTTADPGPKPSRRRRLVKRIVYGLGILALLGVVAVELIGRFYLGLCDPPLLQADSELEYILKPNQDCRQFGNQIVVNEYSMRARAFPRTKSSADEFRIIVFGDSVVYGGSKVDQPDLATSRLERSLAQSLKRPVVVGNVSAGSWGPPNLLAYARRNGFFDADVVVVVVSQQDYDDAMTFERIVDVDPSFPSRKPKLALWETATRYMPRYFAIREQAATGMNPPPSPTTKVARTAEIATAMRAFEDLIRLAKDAGARVIVAQHSQVPELTNVPFAEQAIIANLARNAGAEVIELGPAMLRSMQRGENPYRDYIHPTATGQRIIADVLHDAILGSPATRAAR